MESILGLAAATSAGCILGYAVATAQHLLSAPRDTPGNAEVQRKINRDIECRSRLLRQLDQARQARQETPPVVQ